MLKKIKGAGWHGHHLLESDKGSRALEERLLGPRADGYPSCWHTCRLISSGKPRHFCIYPAPINVEEELKGGWVKWWIIYNPCSVYGEKIQSYSSNPSVVLHGWWLLPHASLTRFKENKITPVLVWQCVRAAASVCLRLALCATRKDGKWGGGGSGMGEQYCCDPGWKKSFAQFYESCICPVGWFYQSLAATVERDLNDGWATKPAGCRVRVISQMNALQVKADNALSSLPFLFLKEV